MNIQNIDRAPKYISDFINKNLTKLFEIYDEGIKENKCGILSFKCSEKENKMDVFFMNEETVLLNITKDSWEGLKISMDSKKLFMVEDLDINSIFLIYI
tara:strand:- start:59 stop:355 length:297 start_codon:yes stop_codon:yes gene_type:complete